MKIDATYTTPAENHNPMEPHATVAAWDGDQLTVYDATQYISGVRETLAWALDVPRKNVRVVSRFIGGGFGCKGMTWPHVTLAAAAARHVGRPVKLVLTRQQMFMNVGYRPRTVQRVAARGVRRTRCGSRRWSTTARARRRTSTSSSSQSSSSRA